MITVADFARVYLERGLAIFDLPARSKKTYDPNWQNIKVSFDTIKEYFPPGIEKNIAVCTGAPSNNLADFDLDTRESCKAAPVLLPPTGWIFGRTSEPKSHWLYRTDLPFGKATEKFLDIDNKTVLLELRGTGGYTVFPGSIHPSGEPITWDQFEEPGELSLAEATRLARVLAAATLLARHWPRTNGVRDDMAMALAGGLLRSGLDEDASKQFITAVTLAGEDEEWKARANKACSTVRKLQAGKQVTGWPKLSELLGDNGPKIVQRVRDWLNLSGTSKTRTVVPIEPFQPFPIEVLPEPLRTWVATVAQEIDVDPSWVALPGLAVCASAIGSTRKIRIKANWVEPCTLWTVIVGQSGTVKSPPCRAALAPLIEFEKEAMKTYKIEREHYESDLEAWRLAKKKHERGGEDPGPKPEPPILRRVRCSDTTIEALGQLLEQNPRGVLLYRDELRAWFNSFTRYKGASGGNDMPTWLELYDSGTTVIDRKGASGPLFLHNTPVSVTGSIQPSILARAMSEEHRESGFAARLIISYPPDKIPDWNENEIPDEVALAYRNLVWHLLALDFDETPTGDKVPHLLRFNSEAKEAWKQFYREWNDLMRNSEGEVRSAFSKLRGVAARLALLFHCIKHAGLDTTDIGPVEADSLRSGIAVAHWAANQVRRFYQLFGETTEERETRRLYEWIAQRGGKATVRDLTRFYTHKTPTVEAARKALDNLVEAGLATWQQQPPGPQGGRPVDVCVINENLPDTRHNLADQGDGEGGEDQSTRHNPPPPDTTDFVNPCVHGVCDEQGGCVGCRVESGTPAQTTGDLGQGEGGCVGYDPVVSGNSPGEPPYLYISDPGQLPTVLSTIEVSKIVSLDLETTGLDPRTDRIRLLALSCDTTDGRRFVYLVDCFVVDPAPVLAVLPDREIVGHNLLFDLQFLLALGFVPGKVYDTMLLAKLLLASDKSDYRVRLQDCCSIWLRISMDKAEQMSDWSAPELSQEQLRYAARDADLTYRLFLILQAEIHKAGLDRVAEIENRCLPAVAWMASKGVPFDRQAWDSLAEKAREDLQAVEAKLDEIAPIPSGNLLKTGRNWNSPQEVKEVLSSLGILVEGTGDEILAKITHPIGALLREHRHLGKAVHAFGSDWAAKHCSEAGRIYPSWRQMGSEAGRMSCSDPNLQQVPRGKAYRDCFRAPPGRVLIKADYSQIELRLAAKISGDKTMLEAYRNGEDLHTKTAQRVLGKTEVTKADRQIAKSLNFGLIYGMGAERLVDYAKQNYGVSLTLEQAQQYKKAFFEAYPGLQKWHRKIGATKNQPIETRTVAGRRRVGITSFMQKLNSPVQGTGADGLKNALAMLWETRNTVPSAFPVLAVHDEIVLEADESEADQAADWLKRTMIAAMAPFADPIPVEVEVRVSRTWGGGE
jgi:DNA polymerase-1